MVLSSADGGRTWAAPASLEVPRVGVDAAGKEHDLSALSVISSGGRGLAASTGEWLWPLEVAGSAPAQRRYLLLREARGGAPGVLGQVQQLFVDLDNFNKEYAKTRRWGFSTNPAFAPWMEDAISAALEELRGP